MPAMKDINSKRRYSNLTKWHPASIATICTLAVCCFAMSGCHNSRKRPYFDHDARVVPPVSLATTQQSVSPPPKLNWAMQTDPNILNSWIRSQQSQLRYRAVRRYDQLGDMGAREKVRFLLAHEVNADVAVACIQYLGRHGDFSDCNTLENFARYSPGESVIDSLQAEVRIEALLALGRIGNAGSAMRLEEMLQPAPSPLEHRVRELALKAMNGKAAIPINASAVGFGIDEIRSTLGDRVDLAGMP